MFECASSLAQLYLQKVFKSMPEKKVWSKDAVKFLDLNFQRNIG